MCYFLRSRITRFLASNLFVLLRVRAKKRDGGSIAHHILLFGVLLFLRGRLGNARCRRVFGHRFPSFQSHTCFEIQTYLSYVWMSCF